MKWNNPTLPVFHARENLSCNRVINVDDVYNSGQLVKCILNGQVVHMTERDCKALGDEKVVA